MEFNNCSNDSKSIEEYLHYLHNNNITANIPAVTMLVLFGVVGLVGNILVMLVYSKKMRLSPTKVLIMTIASFDLVANVMAIPTAITTMFDTWMFNRPGLCKLTVFLGSFTALGGAISLMIVALIRFRKVCRPYGWQLTIKQAIIASITSFLLAFIISIPYIIIYGVRTRETPCRNINGHDCFADDDYFYTIWPFLNNILFVVIYVSLSVSMVVLYTLIGVTAWKHSRLHGLSGAPDKMNKALSTSRLSCAAKESNDPNQQAIRSTNVSTETDLHLAGHKPLRTLFCCSKHKKANEDIPQSIILKSHTTTTDTGIDDMNSDAINPESNITTGSNFEAPSNTALQISLTHQSEQSNSQDVEHRSHVESEHHTENNLNNTSRLSVESNATTNDSLLDDISLDGDNEPKPRLQKDTPKQYLDPNMSSTSKQAASNSPKHGKKDVRRRPLGRMTAMLIIISAIFVLGFLPFLILTVYKNKFPEKYANLNMVEQIFVNLFYRLYFLNSAANPIVYSLCDLNFRRECIRLLNCKISRYL